MRPVITTTIEEVRRKFTIGAACLLKGHDIGALRIEKIAYEVRTTADRVDVPGEYAHAS